MAQFKDSEGKGWEISLPIGEVARIKKESAAAGREFNLYDHELAPKLIADHLLWFELLCHICSEQIESAGLTIAQFGKRLPAKLLLAARKTFMAEWADFFRESEQPELALYLGEVLDLWTEQTNMKQEHLASPEAKSALAKIRSQTRKTTSDLLKSGLGNSEELLAKTLGPIPSEKSANLPAAAPVTSGS